MKKINILILVLLFFSTYLFAQNNRGVLLGKITDNITNLPIVNAQIEVDTFTVFSNKNGEFSLVALPFKKYKILVTAKGYNNYSAVVTIKKDTQQLFVKLGKTSIALKEVKIVNEREETNGITRLKSVDGFGIYESKKTELIILKDLTINSATNNPRQVFSKVPGLNIWESDQAGLQLGVGGRGLSPNRTSNFNTRQNGYDISADALGYPETYYTPPIEALEKIEVVRGAASLQFGTQFGGMLNFVLKKGSTKKIEVVSRQTVGSFGFFGSFNSFGGTVAKGKLNYYTFINRKQANGWRPNSGFEVNTFYTSLIYNFNTKTTLNFDYTFMQYNAQQPGGMTDAQFENNPQRSFRSRNWFKVNWNLFALTFDYQINNKTKLNIRNFGLLSQRYSLGNLERIFVADLGGNRTLIQGDFSNIGSEARVLHQYSLFNKPHTFLVGSRLYYGTTKSLQGDGSSGKDDNYNFNNPNNLEGSNYLFTNKNGSVFIENIFRINTKFTITPGLRAEYINTASNGFYKILSKDLAGNIIADTNIWGDEKNSRSFILAGIGASFKPNSFLEIYANISQNYRAVNFNDLRIVNPNLKVDANMKDESGFSTDFGVRGNYKNLITYDVSLFLLAYNNRIGQVLKADLPPLYQDYRFRTNVANSQNLGIECFVEVDIWKLIEKTKSKNNLLVFTNIGFVNARYINAKDKAIENKKVEMAPPLMLRGGLTYKYQKFSCTFQGNYVTEHYTDATNAVRVTGAVNGIIPTYQVFDFSLGYVYKKFTIESSCNNVFNALYFTRRAESYPGPGIIPSDGRSFYITLGIRL
ncbi:MAG: TonB-dependent receptor [Bacteroidia bacterium]|nr:TonB-dependent receptor [Bacteroidia bacterium]